MEHGHPNRHRVVVIGAGFGGLAVVRGLRHVDVDITVVDANNFHTFQPLLYQVATAGLGSDDIAYAVRGIFRRQRNVSFRMARVSAIDLAARTVTLSAGPPLIYDTLVVAAGAVSNSFGVPGVDEHAFPLKSVEDAVALRNHVLGKFETAGADPTSAHPGALSVVVCGGGPTGVEMAGGLMELFGHVLAKDFPQLDVGSARVVLVEAADRLLGTFHSRSSARARRTLTDRGVEVITGVGVREIDPSAVVLADGRRIDADTVVWAAGVRASPLAEMLGVPLARGRIVVGTDLSVPDHPEVFAIGDIAADALQPLPQVAQPAIQGGHHVACQIGRRLCGQPTNPFGYRDKGSMATIGRHDAVAELPIGLRLAGPLGWLAWLGLHIVYLMGFRNRANVLVNWTWNYFTYDRAARLLTEDDLSETRPTDMS
ncbi:MAG: dehydrogenase (ubiquinone) [Acidimicrobiales bacterium]|nr:dehydrogenase (ubiquinone) [Acidimicrobiales bacterium]